MMTTDHQCEPWARWYEAYLSHRSAARAARIAARERRQAANVVAALLLGFMVLGGVAASAVVGLVMAN